MLFWWLGGGEVDETAQLSLGSSAKDAKVVSVGGTTSLYWE